MSDSYGLGSAPCSNRVTTRHVRRVSPDPSTTPAPLPPVAAAVTRALLTLAPRPPHSTAKRGNVKVGHDPTPTNSNWRLHRAKGRRERVVFIVGDNKKRGFVYAFGLNIFFRFLFSASASLSISPPPPPPTHPRLSRLVCLSLSLVSLSLCVFVWYVL